MLLLLNQSNANPMSLFGSNEPGGFWDPSDFSHQFMDSTGTLPVTAPGDPVGLILDQSRGGLSQIGADLVTNGTFAADSDWTKGTGWSISGGKADYSTGAGILSQDVGLIANRWYRINVELTVASSITFRIYCGNSAISINAVVTTSGAYTFYAFSAGVNSSIGFSGSSIGSSYSIDNISVREVPGNHAYQSSSGARPTLARIPSSGRRNVLTYTEQLDNAAWHKTVGGVASAPVVTANQAANPLNGETTADLVVFNLNGGTGSGDLSQIGFSNFASAEYTSSFYAKTSDGTTKAMVLVGAAGVAVPVTITGSWQRFSTTGTGIGAPRLRLRGSGSGETTADSASIHLFGWQHETGSTATNYQKVVATTDVTESGVGDLWHLVFDGSDDSLVTNAVDFTGTDEMTVIAGVRQSAAVNGVFCELSTSSSTTSGTFALIAPPSDTNGYFWRNRGTGDQYVDTATPVAPTTNVVSGYGKISTDTCVIRINGIEGGSNSNDQGAGNFANAAIYIGRRGGTTLPFNGHIYQLIIRGKTTPEGKLLEAEKFVSKKTGVNL